MLDLIRLAIQLYWDDVVPGVKIHLAIKLTLLRHFINFSLLATVLFLSMQYD